MVYNLIYWYYHSMGFAVSRSSFSLGLGDWKSKPTNLFRSHVLDACVSENTILCSFQQRSYHLCHSWLLCEILMQMFIILSAVYFAYRSYLEKNLNYVADSNEEFLLGSTTTITTANLSNHSPGHHHHTFRVPRHFVALLILHFLIKGFGFWIVRRYMVLLKTSGVRGRNGSNETDENGNSECRTIQQNLPPPSYEQLSKDEPPCYDEALKLCLKDSTMDNSGCTQNHSSESNRSSNTQVDSKDNLPPV